MRFSVIIPVYNVEKYLATCLDSVLLQDFPDYEIIAVNDGSTDGSAEILREYEAKTDKLKVIFQENKGLGGARNTGIIHAQGDYLVFLDSDDYIKNDMLKELDRCLTAHEVDILAFDGVQVTEDGKTISTMANREYQQEYTDLTVKQFLLFEPTACTKVYKRALFSQYRILFPERLWYEDFATTYRVALHSQKIGYLKKPFYYYVQQSGSITHSTNTARFTEITKAFAMNLEEFRKYEAFETYRDELEWNCMLHVLYYSAFRFLTCGCHIKEMKKLYVYSKKIFPALEKNRYIAERADRYDKMNLIVSRRYFLFYLKTGFIIRMTAFVKKLLHKK